MFTSESEGNDRHIKETKDRREHPNERSEGGGLVRFGGKSQRRIGGEVAGLIGPATSVFAGRWL